jgi:hypothetical protein
LQNNKKEERKDMAEDGERTIYQLGLDVELKQICLERVNPSISRIKFYESPRFCGYIDPKEDWMKKNKVRLMQFDTSLGIWQSIPPVDGEFLFAHNINTQLEIQDLVVLNLRPKRVLEVQVHGSLKEEPKKKKQKPSF